MDRDAALELVHHKSFSSLGKRARDASALIVFGLLLSIGWPVMAQDAAQEAGLAVWKAGGCFGCHGTFGEGGPGGDEPAGPSLRSTKLESRDLAETISCGRPSTEMPYHLTGAYAEIACWGLPLGEIPEATHQGAQFTADEISALVEYLLARVVGKGDVTLEECARYYGDPTHISCRRYR